MSKYPSDEELEETLTSLAKITGLQHWQLAEMEKLIRAVYDCGFDSDDKRFRRLLKELYDTNAAPWKIRLALKAWQNRRVS
jgi:hypothetical protein